MTVTFDSALNSAGTTADWFDALIEERDRLRALNAELAAMLGHCAAALSHALAVMPCDDHLYRHTEITEKAARAALAKHKENTA